MNQKGFINIIIIGVIVIIIAVAGYFAMTRKTAEAPTSTQEAGDLATKNWKTYLNNKYGYKLKYPDHWETFGDGDEDSVTIGINLDLPPMGGIFGPEITVYTDAAIYSDDADYIIETKTTLDAFIRKRLQDVGVDYLISENDLVFSGYPAKKFIFLNTTGDGGGSFEYIIFFQKEGIMYGIEMRDSPEVYDDNDKSTYNQTVKFFNQILSTFKFIEIE